MSERDTHFNIFADMHYPELSDLFAELYACQITNDCSGADQARYAIKTLLAQRAYDLVYHAFMTASTVTLEHANLRVVDEEDIKDVPDMTGWPPTPPKP